MTARRPLVLVDGNPQELPAGDTLAGVPVGNGSSALTRTPVTGTYTVQPVDQLLDVTSTATTTITLPSAADNEKRQIVLMRGAGHAGNMSIAATSGGVEAIGGSMTAHVGQAGTVANQIISANAWLVPLHWRNLTYCSDGTNWRLVDFALSNLKASQAKKTVLVMGSSSGNGAGAQVGTGSSATPPADRNGWTQQLATALSATHRFINRCVDGGSAPDLLAVIETYLQRDQPDIVIIALTLGNKWSAQPNVPLGHDEFIDEGRQLLELIRAYGAVPVFTTPQVRSDFNAQKYNFMQSAHRLMSDYYAHLIGLGELTDNGVGTYPASINAGDGIHFNYPTHAHIATQFPRFYLDSQPRYPSPTLPAGAGTRITGASAVQPITLEYGYQSFCVTVDIKRESGAANGRVIASFQTASNNNFRVELTTGYAPRVIIDNGSGGNTVLVTSATVIGTEWQKLTVRYNALQNRVSIYQNAVKTGESTSIGANWTISRMILGGGITTGLNAVDYWFRNVQVHATSPLDGTVLHMHRGNVYRGSLINLSYFNEEQALFTGLRFINELDLTTRWINNQ